jgi:hypothetical protein
MPIVPISGALMIVYVLRSVMNRSGHRSTARPMQNN